ncbi:MAG: hypothetical protein HYT98_00595 [Candidatus Sungbacteria bacterium]|nr:hypothetical protein [Candidatus Sungbacteria bacterium]
MDLYLRGIPFHRVFNSAGARGFCGEGYPGHNLGLNFAGASLITKTITFQPRKGNMPLKAGGTPCDWKPECIVVTPWMFLKGVTMNAVGLSNFGAEWLLNDPRLHNCPEPFLISFMAVGKTPEERIEKECRPFIKLVRQYVHKFKSHFGFETNYTCANAGIIGGISCEEIKESSEIMASIGVPLVVKLNLLAPMELVKEIAEYPYVDAITIGNAIPWDSLWRIGINPLDVYWTTVSPLEKFGGGALSGKPLFHPTLQYISALRRIGVAKPIIACGGIFTEKNVKDVLDAGASAIQLGSMKIHSKFWPWHVQQVIRFARGYKIRRG